jgi:ribosomal protein S18 acetylase RimI-like enzyme
MQNVTQDHLHSMANILDKKEQWLPTHVIGHIDNPKSLLITFYRDCGFVLLKQHTKWTHPELDGNSSEIQIYYVYVKPKDRKCGILRAMMETVKAHAEKTTLRAEITRERGDEYHNNLVEMWKTEFGFIIDKHQPIPHLVTIMHFNP